MLQHALPERGVGCVAQLWTKGVGDQRIRDWLPALSAMPEPIALRAMIAAMIG